MTKRNKLMERLDQAAMQLLDRFFQPTVIGEEPPQAADQIKAFDACVRYYGPRTKLGGDEDAGGSEFEKLRAGLNGRGKTQGRSRRQETAPDAGDEPAGSA